MVCLEPLKITFRVSPPDTLSEFSLEALSLEEETLWEDEDGAEDEEWEEEEWEEELFGGSLSTFEAGGGEEGLCCEEDEGFSLTLESFCEGADSDEGALEVFWLPSEADSSSTMVRGASPVWICPSVSGSQVGAGVSPDAVRDSSVWLEVSKKTGMVSSKAEM